MQTLHSVIALSVQQRLKLVSMSISGDYCTGDNVLVGTIVLVNDITTL